MAFIFILWLPIVARCPLARLPVARCPLARLPAQNAKSTARFRSPIRYDSVYSQPSLYRHSIQRKIRYNADFHRYETFSQEVTVNQKLCKNIIFHTSRNICFGYLCITRSVRLTEAILTYVHNTCSMWKNE